MAIGDVYAMSLPPRLPRRFDARRLAVLSGAFAAAVFAAWFGPHLARRLFSKSAMEKVVAASARMNYRPSLARLSADFPYRDAKPMTADQVPGALWGVISELQGAQDLPHRHALGVSYLLASKPRAAAETLEAALRIGTGARTETIEAIRRSQDAALLNDLAAVYQTLNSRREDQTLQSLALEAAERAWKIEKSPAIAWTRAVAIESYHVRERSVAAWRDYLTLDPGSDWSGHARRRLNELLQPTDVELWPVARDRLATMRTDDPELLRRVDRFRQDVRLWCEDELLPKWAAAALNGDPSASVQLVRIRAMGDALQRISGESEVAGAVEAIREAGPDARRQLARGHLAYGASRLADRNSRVADSIREMDTAVAALTPALTPFAWRARTEHAGMIYMSNDYPRALAELQKLPREDGTLSASCEGGVEALLGIIALQMGSYKEAADHYVRAVEAFREAGERDYEATLLGRLASALERAGDTAQAHVHRQRGLQLLERTGDSKHRHDAMIGAAYAAIGRDHQAVADLFFDALVANDTAAGNHVTTCTSLMWRSAYRYRRGQFDSAAVDLADTERVCDSIADPSLRERALANLELAKSALGSEESVGAPLTGLDDAIRYYQKTKSRVWLRTAYLARARRLVKRDETAAAERDFLAALREGDEGREKIDERQLRISFTATADEIADAYVEFLLHQQRPTDAFEVADQQRLRELVDSPAARWRRGSAAASLPEIQASLPVDAALIEYRVLSKSIVVWAVAPNGIKALVLPVSLAQLEPAIGVLESRSDENESRASASFLYDALLRQIDPLLEGLKTIVIVPDDDLERVAYSALYDHVRQRALIETYATVVAPSAALFSQSRLRWRERSTQEERVVIIQAAAGGENVEALPEAAAEARSLAALYPSARVIDGSRTTGDSLLDQIDGGSLLQFAGHTVVDAGSATRALRFGDTPDARLAMSDILRAPLSTVRLVYLSACETDRGPILKSEGSITIARSFFEAGVPVVVGTLWPVDDAAARLAARTFHEHLRKGDTPAEALRQAQLSVAQRGGRFHDWATFRIIGAGG